MRRYFGGGANRGGAIATELAPAVETRTGYTWDGAPVYALRCSGTMPTAFTSPIVTGVAKLIACFGYGTHSNGSQIAPGSLSGTTYYARVIAGAIQIENSGTFFDGQPFDLVVWYTKT